MANLQRRRFSADMKAKVALEAIQGQKTLPEIAGKYRVHPSQIASWKKEVLKRLAELFTNPAGTSSKAQDRLITSLYEEIGRLTVQLDFLKKRLQL